MRRIISFFLSLMLLASSLVTVSAEQVTAQTDTATENNNVDEQLLSSYKLLSRLGIVDFEESLLNSSAPVTVKEFAYMTLRARNIRSSLPMDSVVGREMVHYGFVASRPYNSNVTYAEAARIALKTIGYTADILGIKDDDFSSWLSKANSLKVFAGVKAYSEDNVTYADAVNIWANLLEINMIMFDSGSNGKISYKEQKGKTLLTECHDIKVVTGVVEENENTGLYDETTVGENQIQINGKVYQTSYDESKYYIGYNIMAYCFASGVDEDKIIFIRPNNKMNDVFVLNASDITEYEDGEYRYSVGQREKYIKLKDVAVIYNQKYLSRQNEEYMRPKNGEIVFIDNNRDGDYDVVSISAYEEGVVVKYITEWDMYVSDKYSQGKGMYLDENKYDVLDIIDRQANPISIAQIKNGDVLTVARSADGRIATVIAGAENIVGKFTTIESDGDEKYFRIGDNSYRISQTAYERLKDELVVGSTYKCVLDYCSNIIDMTTTGVDVYKYAYLRKAYYDANDDILTLKLLTEDGDFISFVCDDKITINGTKAVEAGKVLSLDWVDFKQQLIRYRNNSQGHITAIETAEVTENESKLLHRINDTLGTDTWYSAQSSFSGKVAVSDNAVVFIVPEEGEGNDERLYSVSNGVKALNSGVEGYYAYKEKQSDMQASVIVAVGNPVSAAGSGYGSIMIVSDTSVAVDDDGEPMLKVNGATQNGTTSFVIRTSDVADGLEIKSGDIIRYTIYEGNTAMNVVKLFEYEKGKGLDNIGSGSYKDAIEFPSSATFNNYNVSVMGYVIDTDGKFLKLNQNRKTSESYSESNDMYYKVSGLPIYMFNSENAKAERVTQIKEVNIPDSDTGKDPYVYIFSVYSSAKFAVVYVN